MTPLQRDTLRFVDSYQQENGGVSPFNREIAASIGCATSSVPYIVDMLIVHGFITRAATHRHRSIVITESGYGFLKQFPALKFRHVVGDGTA